MNAPTYTLSHARLVHEPQHRVPRRHQTKLVLGSSLLDRRDTGRGNGQAQPDDRLGGDGDEFDFGRVESFAFTAKIAITFESVNKR